AHVRRAVRTGKVIDFSQAEAATFADILDGLNPAIFLIDADGLIVHGNAAGRAALDQSSLLPRVHCSVTHIDPQVDQALHAAFIAAGKNDAESGGKGSALPMKARA